LGKRTEQHLQDQASYTAAPESIEKANRKRAARIAQELRQAPPPIQPRTDSDDLAHDRAMTKLRNMGFRVEK
jgi:hypothetical protein